MPNFDSNVSTFIIAATIAGGLLFTSLDGGPADSSKRTALWFGTSAEAQDVVAPQPRWAASAAGRVEPTTGAVRVSPRAGGRIEKVFAKIGDRVSDGDILVQLDDSEARQRVVAARAEVKVRELERGEETVKGLALERRQAEDEVAAAERAIFDAWQAFDDTLALKRKDEARDSDVVAAREIIKTETEKRDAARVELAKLNKKSGMPLPGRLDTGLTIARADLSLAEEALQKTRIRAPFDGSILNVFARVGETVAPGPQTPLLVFGDLSKMRVRAEVEERDVAKVRLGQKVVVKADAYPDRDFEGTVSEISGALGSPQIATRGPRRPTDVDVLEVIVELDGTPPLLTGMRVDVFFHRQGAHAAKSASVAQAH
ncbi:MAG: efflux RND transporter periplasmic adaptor subunit [Alphaproteobacteria bacterium]|nr:efflux RND transporter periplasmic adaptor subunit [Alphaproteobacteria bacterium]